MLQRVRYPWPAADGWDFALLPRPRDRVDGLALEDTPGGLAHEGGLVLIDLHAALPVPEGAGTSARRKTEACELVLLLHDLLPDVLGVHGVHDALHAVRHATRRRVDALGTGSRGPELAMPG